MEELVLPGIVGMVLPLVISFLKRQQWASQVKKVFAFIVCIAAAVIAYFAQHGGWVGWEQLFADFAVIYALAQVTYSGLWQDTAVEVRLSQVGSA